MSLFFGDDDEPAETKCIDCGTTENLHILYTTENGTSTWICQNCQDKREDKGQAQEVAERARIRAHENFDEYEEPTR